MRFERSGFGGVGVGECAGGCTLEECFPLTHQIPGVGLGERTRGDIHDA